MHSCTPFVYRKNGFLFGQYCNRDPWALFPLRVYFLYKRSSTTIGTLCHLCSIPGNAPEIVGYEQVGKRRHDLVAVATLVSVFYLTLQLEAKKKKKNKLSVVGAASAITRTCLPSCAGAAPP